MSWGGKRAGAGRKPGWRKENPNPRAHRSLLAHDDEWLVIKDFIKIMRKLGAEKTAELIKNLKDSSE